MKRIIFVGRFDTIEQTLNSDDFFALWIAVSERSDRILLYGDDMLAELAKDFGVSLTLDEKLSEPGFQALWLDADSSAITCSMLRELKLSPDGHIKSVFQYEKDSLVGCISFEDEENFWVLDSKFLDLEDFPLELALVDGNAWAEKSDCFDDLAEDDSWELLTVKH